MKWRVLVTAPYLQPVLDKYRHVLEKEGIELVVPRVRERMEEEELLPLVKDVHGAICGDDRFTAKVLHEAKNLKVIAKWGTGIDSIDKDAAESLGITVFNTANAFTDPVADTVLGYVLMFARQLHVLDRDVKSHQWTKRSSVSLKELALGVIGVGNIGRAVIKRAAAFGMKFFANDIVEIPKTFVSGFNLSMVSKEKLLRDSDFVSINCTLNPTSFHLISDREFALMKSTAFLINTARGPIIDEEALVRALRSRKIGGAALDVFEKEPLPEESPLREFPNVILAPHNANSSPSAWEFVHENTVRMLISGLHNHHSLTGGKEE